MAPMTQFPLRIGESDHCRAAVTNILGIYWVKCLRSTLAMEIQWNSWASVEAGFCQEIWEKPVGPIGSSWLLVQPPGL